MADEHFNVVFRGQLTGDLPEHAVQQNLAAMFKMSQSKAEALFTGKPIVVKRGVDEATARKFERAFEKAGAVCEVQPAGAGQEAAGAEEAAPAGGAARARADRAGGGSGAAQSSPSGAGSVRARGSVGAAGDPNRTVVHMEVPQDLGGLDVDDSGQPLAPDRDRTPPRIDTSELQLAEDEGPIEPPRDTTPPDIDTSGLALEDESPQR